VSINLECWLSVKIPANDYAQIINVQRFLKSQRGLAQPTPRHKLVIEIYKYLIARGLRDELCYFKCMMRKTPLRQKHGMQARIINVLLINFRVSNTIATKS